MELNVNVIKRVVYNDYVFSIQIKRKVKMRLDPTTW